MSSESFSRNLQSSSATCDCDIRLISVIGHGSSVLVWSSASLCLQASPEEICKMLLWAPVLSCSKLVASARKRNYITRSCPSFPTQYLTIECVCLAKLVVLWISISIRSSSSIQRVIAQARSVKHLQVTAASPYFIPARQGQRTTTMLTMPTRTAWQ